MGAQTHSTAQTSQHVNGLTRFIPILAWLPRYDRSGCAAMRPALPSWRCRSEGMTAELAECRRRHFLCRPAALLLYAILGTSAS
jgi:hypothetical protein